MKKQLIQLFLIFICIQWLVENVCKFNINSYIGSIICMTLAVGIQRIYLTIKPEH